MSVPGCSGRCSYCRRLKKWYYSSRIVAECSVHEKSWFVTLTLRFKMTDGVGYKLVQRFLKRLRKKDSVRYACVAEHGGKSTRRLHYHLVLHGGPYLTQRSIRKCWKGGISQAVLVGGGDALNVARYSSKLANYTSKGGRFRFSQAYGSSAMKKWMPAVEVVSKEFRCEILDMVLRFGSHRMPRKLYRKHVPVVDVVRLNEQLSECRTSTLIEQIGPWLPLSRSGRIS